MILGPNAETKALVAARVRRGETIRSIARDIGYGEDTISGHWRHGDPHFADLLDQARRHALVMADREAKLALLAWIQTGRTVAAWIGRRRGRPPGPGSTVYGIHHDRTVRYWRARDPWFAGEYDRLQRTRARTPRPAIDLDLDQAVAALQRTGSLKAAGLDYTLVDRLRRHHPNIFERIGAAWLEGRAAQPRRGRMLKGLKPRASHP